MNAGKGEIGKMFKENLKVILKMEGFFPYQVSFNNSLTLIFFNKESNIMNKNQNENYNLPGKFKLINYKRQSIETGNVIVQTWKKQGEGYADQRWNRN
jgi:hypothetical protein